jgi:hypothetical protein
MKKATHSTAKSGKLNVVPALLHEKWYLIPGFHPNPFMSTLFTVQDTYRGGKRLLVLCDMPLTVQCR